MQQYLRIKICTSIPSIVRFYLFGYLFSEKKPNIHKFIPRENAKRGKIFVCTYAFCKNDIKILLKVSNILTCHKNNGRT